MGNWLGFGLWIVIALVIPGRAVAQSPSVRVVVHDSAAVDAPVLAEARDLSAGVFRDAGVDADITRGGDPCPVAATRFCVMVLLRAKHPQFEPGKSRTMGVALEADANRAVVSIYLDAVIDVARRYGHPVGKVLGIALAHEIGHVLLPSPSHSDTGIMQAAWEGDALRHAIGGDLRFTERQAATIRARLTNRTAMP